MPSKYEIQWQIVRREIKILCMMHFFSFASHFSYPFPFPLLSRGEASGRISSPVMIYLELSTRASPDPRLETMDIGLMSKLNHPLLMDPTGPL